MKNTICILLAAASLLALCSCGREQTVTQPMTDPISDNYRSVYQIFVGSFSDSDGDGTGDLQGIINRMDYLNDGDINSGDSLGVQCLWLSPLFSSPSYHKYDTVDYYKIDGSFGTEDDLKALVSLCHERNVSVILDLAINHTSKSNVWFQKFANAHRDGNTDDEYYDFYTWATADERASGRTWSQIDGSADYYECNFSGNMPELNYDNPAVYSAMLDVAEYYLDLGIDGFRFDAAKYIYFGDTSANVECWEKYLAALREYKPDIYTVAEVWSSDSEILSYCETVNCFEFQMSGTEGAIAYAAQGKKGRIDTYTKYVCNICDSLKSKTGNPDAMLVPFVSNHDMDRAAGYATVSTGNAYMAANLYLLCAGSPVIYYGEEIGLKGTRGSASTDANRRLAMLWGDGDAVKNPTGSTFDDSSQINGTVAEQLAEDGSLLNHYKKLLTLRTKYPAIARGDYSPLIVDGSDYVGGFIIDYQEEKIAILHNTSNLDETIDLTQCEGCTALELLDYAGANGASIDGSRLTIEGKTSVILG